MYLLKKILVIIEFSMAIVLVLMVYILQPVFLIRWHRLNSSRIGHFAADTELYCCERDSGINVPKGLYVDLFYFQRGNVCNNQLAVMWKRELNIIPSCIGVIFDKASIIIDFLSPVFGSIKLHIIPDNVSHDRDVNNLLEGSKPHLKFTKNENKKGQSWLNKNKIPNNAKIVLLMVRDSAYLDNSLPEYNWEYHSYRDSDISHFFDVSEELAGKGFYVIRMGQTVAKKLQLKHQKVFDYATNGMRTDFIDIFLSSICTFIVSTGTGIDSVACTCFRKPSVFVNISPVGYFPSYSSNTLLLSKHYISTNSNKELTLSEIFKNNVGYCNNTKCYYDKEVELVESTSGEITDVVLEMVARLDGSWQEEYNDQHIHSRFLDIYRKYISDKNKKQLIHGEIRFRYSMNFLRNNPEYIK